jgi:7,8-dihydropterin-6-yl-methyl-4-(beta-D-ribofuranosyl)aminobenzene 5'-phosphate synthase
MHLLNASEERLEFTIQELRQRDVSALVPLHCTGWGAIMRLWNAFPGLCGQGGVGTTLRFATR